MNDPMNHDPFDRELDQLLGRAFASRADGPVSSPSMLDVRHRARLRHRRRIGAMVGSVAVVGVGGAAVLAKGHDTNDRVTTPGSGSDVPRGSVDLPSTTALCTPVTTDVDPNGFATTTITVALGDPGVDTTTPNAAAATSTTTIPPGTDTLAPYDCTVSSGATMWACRGPMGQDDIGRPLFASCEPAVQGWPAVAATTIPCGPNDDCDPAKVETTVPTTSSTCPPGADCTAPTTTVLTGGVSSIFDPGATTTTAGA